jgi:hypothetical protein
LAFALSAVAVGPARADGPARPSTVNRRALVDRTFVRYVSPETGGSARPRFLTYREVSFFARIEGLIEGDAGASDIIARFGRAAVDRLVAEDMLGALQTEQGSEPPNLPRMVREQREDLELRVGAEQLSALQKTEGISDAELEGFLRRRVRAAFYLDRFITPLARPSEDELFAAFRGTAHPYRSLKYEDVRPRFLRYFVFEKMRTAELDYVQSARSRIALTYL